MRVTSPSSRGLLVAEQGYLRGPRGGCLLQMTGLCPLHSPAPPPWRWGRQELAFHAVIAPRPMAGKPTPPDSGRSQPSSQRHADAASPLPSRSRSTGFSVRWLCLPGSSHTATCSPPPLKIYSMWIPIHYQWLCSQPQQQQAREDGGCHDPPGSERRMRDVCSALTALSTTARPHLSYPSVQAIDLDTRVAKRRLVSF